jgi:hypothetical protein
MTAQPPHKHRLVLGGAALTKSRNNRHNLPAMGIVSEELEKVLVDSGYLHEAPFSWVSVIIRYGLTNEITPHYQSINKKFGDLPLSIEIDSNQLVGASLEHVVHIFKVAVLNALIHAGKKHNRPHAELEALRNAEPGVVADRSRLQEG